MIHNGYYSPSANRFGWSHDNKKVYLQILALCLWPGGWCVVSDVSDGGWWAIHIQKKPDLHLATNTPLKRMFIWSNAIEELVLDS